MTLCVLWTFKNLQINWIYFLAREEELKKIVGLEKCIISDVWV